MQPMPVLDRLLVKRHTAPDEVQEDIDIAWGAVKVRADSAADMYWQTPKEVWRRDSDFPPVRMPFPAIWMEWDQPDQWLTDGNRVIHRQDTEIGTHRAVLLREVESSERKIRVAPTGLIQGAQPFTVPIPRETARSFTMSCHMLREGKACLFPFAGVVHVDEMGNQLREAAWVGPVTDDRSRATVDLLHTQFGKLAILAVGLMNCKNVQLSEHESEVPIGRRQRRRNKGVTYRTIDIPGHTTGIGGTSTGDQSMPMHRVRGHFKTFAPEAPLLGQHVGTYWWGWQVRGHKKNGSVVSDYKLGERGGPR